MNFEETMPVFASNEESITRAMVSNSIKNVVNLVVVAPFDAMFLEIFFLNLQQLAKVKSLFNLAVQVEQDYIIRHKNVCVNLPINKFQFVDTVYFPSILCNLE